MADDSQNSANLNLLAHQAIEAAISLNWQKAVKINQKILSSIENDTGALNRLARAKLCLGRKQEAQKFYKRVLELDPYNLIARKNLEKITKSDGNALKANGNNYPNNLSSFNLANLFIFEPGKTKLVYLLNLAPPSVLASLSCGDQVLINPKNHSVAITTLDKVYLGALPDDLAHRLIAFISGGNKYDSYVKNATTKSLVVFIKEVFRSAKFASQPSFQYRQTLMEEQDIGL